MVALMSLSIMSFSFASRGAEGPATEAVFAEKPEKKEQLMTRVYDVRDLLVQIPDYPYKGELGVPIDKSVVVVADSPPSTQPHRTPTSKEELADNLIDLIKETIATDTWRDNGGSLGAIRELGGQLIVTQTLENQKLLESLLSQLREANGRMVRVQARWLLLAPGEARGLLVAQSPDPGIALVDQAALDKLPDSMVTYRGEVTCFNAQAVSIASGRTHSAITDQQPVVAQNAVAMSPTVRQVQAGIMLEVLPTLQAGKDGVVVDLKTRLAQWNDPTPLALPSSVATTRPADLNVAGATNPAAIDRLNMVSQDLKTAIRMPLGKPVLVGGLTLDPTPAIAGGQQLYLVLRIDATREDSGGKK
jgi:hypothetical protein